MHHPSFLLILDSRYAMLDAQYAISYWEGNQTPPEDFVLPFLFCVACIVFPWLFPFDTTYSHPRSELNGRPFIISCEGSASQTRWTE